MIYISHSLKNNEASVRKIVLKLSSKLWCTCCSTALRFYGIEHFKEQIVFQNPTHTYTPTCRNRWHRD